MNKLLRELADIHYGKSPNEVLIEDGLFPVVGTGGVYGKAKQALFDGPAIVVARKGSLGNPQLMIAPFWPVDTTYAVVPKNGIDARWLFYNLDKYDLTKLNEATGVPSISRDWLYRITFDDPGTSSQKRIGDILEAVDESIVRTKALIAKYQQIKAGLMHDLFKRGVTKDGKLRPPREEAPELYKKSPIGWIPQEWDSLRLGVILKDAGGYLQTGPFGSQLHAHEYRETGVPVVMPQDITDGRISTMQIARIDESRANTLGRHRLKRDDIIIARRGELSRAAAIRHDEEGWLCGTGCFLLRLGGSRLLPDFISYAYRHDIVQRQITGRAVGTTMASLNNEVMSALCFPYMHEDEQREISERLTLCEERIRFLEKEQLKLSQKKQGLMHDLLTGRVRIKAEGLAK